MSIFNLDEDEILALDPADPSNYDPIDDVDGEEEFYEDDDWEDDEDEDEDNDWEDDEDEESF